MARKVFSFLLGVAVVALLAEMSLRFLPVPTASMTGYYRDADLLTNPPHHQWTTATGWDLRNPQTLRANNWGFVADHDFVPDTEAVALIGDSYVEASMLTAKDRPAAQLEALLDGKRKVYALGTPGTALLDYAQRIRVASEQFGVKDFVLLLERYDARQALCGSGNVVSRCLDPVTLQARIERRREPDTWTRIARHSALAQYLVGQLRFTPAALMQAMFTRITPEERHKPSSVPSSHTVDPAQIATTKTMVDAVVGEFYAQLPAAAIRHLVIVVDGQRDGPNAEPKLIDVERAYLIARLRERGATVHDMEPIYGAHAATSPRSLQVGPYDGHLNPLGVRLAMAAAAQSLRP